MKTAISVPDEVFEQVSRRALDLGMSRSQFFARAAVRLLDELDSASTTERIDAALAGAGPTDSSTVDAAGAGRRRLAGGDDEW